MTQNYKFGEIWLADLNPRIGTEAGKTRPVLIIQSQFLLDVDHPSTIIIPLTMNLIDDSDPLRIRIKAQNNIHKDSDIMIDQIRAIDNKRLVQGPLLKCSKDLLDMVQTAIKDILGFGYNE